MTHDAAPTSDHALTSLLEPAPWPFGAGFFLHVLRGFVRDRCPTSAERIPRLQLWLSTGEAIEVCHVIALAPTWVALAAGDRGGEMRTEILPYQTISRVTISATAGRDHSMGFNVGHRPLVVDGGAMSPEDALAAAGGVADGS